MARQRQHRKRSPLQEELMSLLDDPDGVYAEVDIDLPLLRNHAAVLTRQQGEGKKQFLYALTRLLNETLVLFRQPMEDALRTHFALTQEARDMPLKDRKDQAAFQAGKDSYEAYSKDRRTATPPTRSPLSVALDRLEEYFGELATVTPASLPGERTNFDHAPDGPHHISVARGRVVIENVVSIASCDREHGARHELLLEFEKEPRGDRPPADEWPLLQAQLLPALVGEAANAGAEFRDEPGLDLVYIQSQSLAADGTRLYKAGVAATTYYRWATTANCLDRDLRERPELVAQLGAPNLRKAWKCHPTSLEDLTRLPAPALMGVCVVVIAEEQIVVLQRQGVHYVAGRFGSGERRRPAHFVGEGMTPADKDPTTGRFSPEQAALRGCEEELGLAADQIGFTLTAVIIDVQRWQPVFCFVGDCDLEIADLEERMQFAPDRRETLSRIAAQRPNTIRDELTRRLLTGEDPELLLASNHAEAALLHALFYADGREEVRKQLTKPTSK
jgi:hypothetical protein